MLIKVLYDDHIRVIPSKLQSIRYDVAAIAIHDATLKSRCLDLGRDCDVVILIVFTIFFFCNSSRNIENLNVTDTITSQLGVDNLMSSFCKLNIKTIFDKKLAMVIPSDYEISKSQSKHVLLLHVNCVLFVSSLVPLFQL